MNRHLVTQTMTTDSRNATLRRALLDLLVVVGDEENAMFDGNRLNAAFIKASEAIQQYDAAPVSETPASHKPLWCHIRKTICNGTTGCASCGNCASAREAVWDGDEWRACVMDAAPSPTGNEEPR